MQLPWKPHLDSVRCTLRYMSATLDYGLFYAAGIPMEPYGYTDADWAGSISDKRSTSGFHVFLWECCCDLEQEEAAHNCLIKYRGRV